MSDNMGFGAKRLINKTFNELKNSANQIENGVINGEIYITGEKSSFILYTLSQSFPFFNVKPKIEEFLFLDVPVENNYTNVLHVAVPFSVGGNIFPMQLSCVIDGKIPDSIFLTKEGFTSNQGDASPIYENLINDESIKELSDAAIQWKHKTSTAYSGYTQELPWTIAITPVNNDKIICTLHTGIETEGTFNVKYNYKLKLYMALLQQIMKSINELNYSGTNKLDQELLNLLYEFKRNELKGKGVNFITLES